MSLGEVLFRGDSRVVSSGTLIGDTVKCCVSFREGGHCTSEVFSV